jgi:hypothetical protein
MVQCPTGKEDVVPPVQDPHPDDTRWNSRKMTEWEDALIQKFLAAGGAVSVCDMRDPILKPFQPYLDAPRYKFNRYSRVRNILSCYCFFMVGSRSIPGFMNLPRIF